MINTTFDFWLLTWLATLTLICIKPCDAVIMAILICCLNFFVMQIWNGLKVCCIAPLYVPVTYTHWSLCQWNSTLSTALLFSPTATITCTNIHCFTMYFWRSILTACVVVWPAIHCYTFCVISFLIINCRITVRHKRFHFFYRDAGIVTVRHFLCNMMAFLCQEIKELLSYLLTYLN